LLKQLGRAILVGAASSIALAVGVVALSMLGFPQPFSAYLFSAVPISYVLFAIAPDAFVYWLVPDGGGPAAVGIFLIAALVQTTIGGAALYLGLGKMRSFHRTPSGC
jgi:hypothetical protein